MSLRKKLNFIFFISLFSGIAIKIHWGESTEVGLSVYVGPTLYPSSIQAVQGQIQDFGQGGPAEF